MTLRDEYLTFHDSMSNSVRASSLRGFGELVRSLGGDPAAMLDGQKLPEKLLSDDELLLPALKLARLLEATARALECPDFGLRLAQAQDMGILGPIAVAIQNSPTLGEALKIASRYMYVHNQGLAITLVADGSAGGKFAELRYETSAMHLPGSRQSFELMLCGGHRILTLLGGDRYRLEAVHFPHAPVAGASAYRHAFGIAPRFNQPTASLIVPRKLFDAALPQANATLRNLATHYLESTFDAPKKSMRLRVHLAIARTLGTSQCALEGVAAMLAMHPRTLQRQLSLEGVRFADVRDAVMREAALRYLAGPLPLVQVSEQLGLSEQSALTRSCRRWFGETPLAIRRREQMAASASRAPGTVDEQRGGTSPSPAPAAPLKPLPEIHYKQDFRVGQRVSFTDQSLKRKVGEIVRINQRTATVHCDGRAWHMAFALLQHIPDITP